MLSFLMGLMNLPLYNLSLIFQYFSPLIPPVINYFLKQKVQV